MVPLFLLHRAKKAFQVPVVTRVTKETREKRDIKEMLDSMVSLENQEYLDLRVTRDHKEFRVLR